MNLVPIAEGVNGLFIKNDRFSTTHISVNLYLPLEQRTIAVNALLPFVLSSCSAEYPDFSALNLRLNELYGAEVGGIADKIGDTQVLRFFSYFIDDEYIPNGEKVADEAVELLISMLFKPSVKGVGFLKADVEREKRLTLEKIAGIINDKRSYAISRIIAEMYKGEPFGELKTGSAEDVLKITGESLYSAYQNVLSSAEVRIQVIGKKLPDRLFERIANGLKGYERIKPTIYPSVPKKLTQKINRVLEEMDVSQGKLVMGFCTDFVGDEKQTAFLTVFADLFGGGPYSKLFANVREKLSLCYYCAARPNRNKGYLLVDCGVESENAQKAETEILNQLNELKLGKFTNEELQFAISSIKDSLACLNDSQSSLDGWYAMRPFGEPISPEEYIKLIENVTKEDIIKAADLYRLDTVYQIMPQDKKGE